MKKIFTLLFLVLLSGMSYAQWSTDPNQNNLVAGIPTDEAIPKVATAMNGHTYISWFSLENGNYNVRLQQYDVDGYELFAAGGILISDHPSMTWLTDYNMTVDKENCAIIGFQDIRNGNSNIHVYKVSPSGQMVWGNDGLSLSNNTAFEPYPVIAVTNDNQSTFAWQSEDAMGQGILRLQRVMPDSTRVWGPSGIVYASSNPAEKYIYPYLVPSTNNDVILIFHKQTGSFTSPKDIYAQKFNSAGVAVWPNDVPIYVGPGVPIIPSFCVEPDSLGGAVICWHDTRQGNGMFNVYVQHVSDNGVLQLVANGQVVTTLSGNIQMNPSMAYFPSTQEIVTFFDVENTGQSAWGLSGQKFSATGQTLWGNSMLTLIPVGATNISSIKVRKAANQVFMTYQLFDFSNFVEARIYATALDLQGNYLWTPTTSVVCNVQSEKVHQVTGYYNSSQLILAWEDNRDGNPDLYAQNILINGDLGPAPTAVPDIDPNNLSYTFSAFPNPMKDVLQISITGGLGMNAEVDIFNLLGEKVARIFSGELSAAQQNIDWKNADLDSGLYFIRAVVGQSNKTIAVVVQ